MKLSNKILFSYMLLLVMAFLIAGFIASTTVTARLKRQAREDLTVQADGIVESIEESKFQLDEPRRLVTYMRNSSVATLVTADIFLLNSNRQVIFSSNEAVNREVLLNILKGKNNNYVAVYRALEDDGKPVGYLLLTTELKNIEVYTDTLRRSLILGMFIALIIGAVIALIMRMNIVRPIISLQQDIARNIEDPEFNVRPIDTGDELEDLYRTYSAMNQSIRNHLEERKRYFQNASHELKTPLMSIQGYAEAIRDGVMEGDEIDQSLDIIIQKSKQLKRTVEEIIYLSKLANDDFDYKFERTPIVALIQSAIEDHQLTANEKGIRILLEADSNDPILSVDRMRFESALINLLSNGVRYATSTVKVILQDDSEEIILRIVDDGPGLKRGEEQKVFERFYKGDNGNSGIGLAIVQEIIHKHGGTILAGNHISGGAVFKIIMKKVQHHG